MEVRRPDANSPLPPGQRLLFGPRRAMSASQGNVPTCEITRVQRSKEKATRKAALNSNLMIVNHAPDAPTSKRANHFLMENFQKFAQRYSPRTINTVWTATASFARANGGSWRI